MSDTALLAMVAAILSAALQVAKDKLALNPSTLRWVATVLGAAAGGIVAWVHGTDGTSNIIALLGAGAGLTAGTHSVLLQGSVLGRMLKAIGEAIVKKEN